MKIKYPRTPHCPWSEGRSDDDKVVQNMNHFKNREVVVTVKMDGENSSCYRDAIHARSLDSNHHESRSMVKQIWNGKIRFQIPEGMRICGENLYARHSIAYDNLPSYFLAFSVWDGVNDCMDWDFSVEVFENLGLDYVPVLYRGIYDEDKIKSIWSGNECEGQEGYVIRNAGRFSYEDFNSNVAKFVRKNHVQSDEHWMHQKIIPNKLLDKAPRV
jgi:hypothetical protein